ncbi:MAG: phosphatase PAP2 family protein [Gammaproteobacteria bacterium]|nr:phosphatase PAP2 family protein [Gammaproteobacteria bacterium]MBU1414430.1 phosphatase PAP2 family protein [Gammaproteobacteria bacterium]
MAVLLALLIWASDTNVLLFHLINDATRWLPVAPLLAFTLWGNTLAGLALVSGWIRSCPRILWAVLFALPPGMLFVRGLKLVLAVPRPAAVLDPGTIVVVGPVYRAFSFPSGHATTAFAFAAIIWLLSRNRPLRIAVLVLATMVAVSRVLVGVHWPVDVLVGAAGGWVCGSLGVFVATRYRWTANKFGQRGAALIAACAGVGLLFTRFSQPFEAATGWILATYAFAMAGLSLRALQAEPADDLGGESALVEGVEVKSRRAASD